VNTAQSSRSITSTVTKETGNVTSSHRFSIASFISKFLRSESARGQAGQGRSERGVLRTRASEDAGMRSARRALSAVGCAAVAMGLFLTATPASAAPPTPGTGWAVSSFAFPTYLSPGTAGKIQLDFLNTGTVASAGPITVTDTLPPGLTAIKAGGMHTVFILDHEEEGGDGEARWDCVGNGPEEAVLGATLITCTSDPAVLAPVPSEELFAERVGVEVEVAPEAAATQLSNEVTVAGGGASHPTTTADPLTVSSSPSPFGFSGWNLWLTNADGTSDAQAGSHPSQMTVDFGLNELADAKLAGGELRNLAVDLPPGFFGNLSAIPRCPRANFDAGLAGRGTLQCPRQTLIGIDVAGLSGAEPGVNGTSRLFRLGVYNLVPPPGIPAQFGFALAGQAVFLTAQVRSQGGYTLAVNAGNLPQVGLDANLLSLWGVPADPSHDAQRGAKGFCEGEECSVEGPAKPFLTLPTSCAGPQPFTIRGLGAWQDEAARAESTVLTHGNDGIPAGFTGCNQLDFSPSIEARPTTNAADSATGLNVDLHLPQNEDPEGLTEANLKSTTVALPNGIAVNPAGANGLASCSSAQIGLTTPVGQPKAEFNEAVPQCPDASKIGTVEVDTQLLDHPLPGFVYIAAQTDNPFKSLLALYVVVNDPKTGVLLKIAGEVRPDPQTGQLTATFPENPELPFEDLKVDFFNGAHATLTTPSACGRYETTTSLVPWTTPEGADATPADAFAIEQGAGGAPCPASEAALPNRPAFTAGTLAPRAGAYSPFVLHLAREDGSQRIKAIDATLPPGLVGKLAGVAECSEAQLSAAAAREVPGQGKLEQSSPSCPLASEVGTVNVGAGAGPDPLFVSGHAYLAGPYKGAPLSLAIITPAVAGPFDLGNVVVRTALYVNPETAQIHAVSDPLPTILDGIPLDVRSIALDMSRPDFTLNPTSCDAMTVLASATSTLGQSAALTSPFQVGECSQLAFAPKLAIQLKGGTQRTKHPALTATVTYPTKGAYANVASASVALPHGEFLDQSHIKTICTRVQFAAGAGNGEQCPAGSVYGFAKATTPLLDKPVEGPVYLRSSSHSLPDLVAALHGQVDVVLDGRVDTDKQDGIRNSFEMVPDAPVTKFTLSMQGGKKGLLVNSENICNKPQRATVHLTAQNGKVEELSPLIANSCKAKKGGKHTKHKGEH
jgi:hypothetical protein